VRQHFFPCHFKNSLDWIKPKCKTETALKCKPETRNKAMSGLERTTLLIAIAHIKQELEDTIQVKDKQLVLDEGRALTVINDWYHLLIANNSTVDQILNQSSNEQAKYR
jgi:hypothetical protein